MALGSRNERPYAGRTGRCREEAMGALPGSVQDSANGSPDSAPLRGLARRFVARVVRRSAPLWAVPILAVGVVALSSGGRSVPASAATPKAVYYVAMGDSLAAGVGATQVANRYTDLVYQHERARFPGLQLINLSCVGATTTTVLNGGGCTYATGSQMGAAEAFLQSHPGQVAFLTIDIGADNVNGCFALSGIDATCIQNGENRVMSDLPQILKGLQSSYPGLLAYGMDYYDPYLATWLLGASGQALAHQSAAYTVSFNTLLGQIYGAAGMVMADLATLFETTNFAMTGSFQGTPVPQNVALVCQWTLMCTAVNIHANDAGHAELATAFNQAIDRTTGTESSKGYWLVASDGGIFTYGDAGFFGSAGARSLNGPIVGTASTPDGRGYWLVASDGGIFSYGDAGFFGSTGNVRLNQPVVGMASTPDGRGYWLVASDGGIFSRGNAHYYGSMGGKSLNKPIVGMASTPDGGGYWLVASDGGIFSYGDAGFFGSMGGKSLNKPIVGMAVDPATGGYWEVANDGGIFS